MKSFFIVWAVLAIATIGGWIANIIKLVSMGMPVDVGHASILFILRIIGILAFPLGSVLGIFF